MIIYLVVLSVAALSERSVPLVVVLTAAAVLVPAALPSRHRGIDTASAFTIP